MEQDRNRHTMFLTSLLIANQDGKGDPKRTMQLIKSKITSVIQNHEQHMNDETFGCGAQPALTNFNSSLACRNQVVFPDSNGLSPQQSIQDRIAKSCEIKPDKMFLDFAQSTQKSFVGLKKQYSTVNMPSKESVKDIIKKVLYDVGK